MTAEAIAQLCYRTLLDDGVAAITAARAQAVTPALKRIIEANTLLSGLGFEFGWPRGRAFRPQWTDGGAGDAPFSAWREGRLRDA